MNITAEDAEVAEKRREVEIQDSKGDSRFYNSFKSTQSEPSRAERNLKERKNIPAGFMGIFND